MKKLFYMLMVAAVVAGGDVSAQQVVWLKKSDRLDANGLPKDLKAPSANRVTREEMNAKRKKIDRERNYMIVPNKSVPMNPSIYDNSTIIAYDGKHTILPEGAVMFVPEVLSDRVVNEPVGQFVLWPEFLRQNFGWLRTIDLSVEEATGKEHLKEPLLEAIVADQRISVSVYQRHPISYRGDVKKQLKAAKSPGKG
ncbi:hypothetical protein [Sulfuriroseicoccus oceanibius]|uniref:Uncharacterized protein n=1 Tax=Sulfuriroseicoccus oceanibius TaxID=2707525 RepID=A0A6B3LA02_9BACT|nr:hypothetical protein [Sulfuriroseicoccus oceanibius]QQL44526.1 hypothetical protein G3M56_011635 [Sulfuriroseicoccus oceanibius]